MRSILSFLVYLFILNVSFGQDSIGYSKTELIVKFKSEVRPTTDDQLNIRLDIPSFDELNQEMEIQNIYLSGNKKESKTFRLLFKKALDIDKVIELYLETGLFEYVEPNYIGHGGGQKMMPPNIPNDTYFNRQWGLQNNGTFTISPPTIDSDIDMELAWDIEKGSSAIIVAILDSGVKMDHPEFEGRIWSNESEVNNGQDNDGNGYVDDQFGWDFANNDNNPKDDQGHGTNVAGIVGANGNNGIGYAGVDWNCKLMVCKILDSNNRGFYSWWTDAIYYAVDNGADVINMSVGGQGSSSLLGDAISYAFNNGVVVVACMMNFDNNRTYYPAGFSSTIAVGSTDPNDNRTTPFFWDPNSGSNYGQHIDVVAPGNYIYGLSYNSNSNYNSYWGGTSQATPLVTGLSALLLAQYPNRTVEDIRTIIRNSAEDLVGNSSEDKSGFDPYYGYGRLNAHQALSQFMVNTDHEEQSSTAFTVFPNPSANSILVESEQTISEIQIFDLKGIEVVRKKSIDAGRFKIDVTNLSKGIYVLVIKEKGTGKVSSKKIIIEF